LELFVEKVRREFLEGRLDKTTNEYWTEVAIPHVLSSTECSFNFHR